MTERLIGRGIISLPSCVLGMLASLAVDSESITMRMLPLAYSPSYKFKFERASIKYLVEGKKLGFSWIRIVHLKKEFPKWFIFLPCRSASLRQALTRFNYEFRKPEQIKEADDSRTGINLIWLMFLDVVLGFL